jgi:hypothetical protein
MEVKAVLLAIKADPSQAAKMLELGLQGDRRAFLAGLGTWVAAALAGVVIDPEHL